MISYVKGKLVVKTPAHAVIDCNGIGYYIHISLNTFSSLGEDESCKLLTHLIVREDAHVLYGFIDEQEREMFKKLISVSGVGANTARLILSSLVVDHLVNAITSEDVNTLKSIKGIGAKSAQRIIVDLKDKVSGMEISENVSVSNNTIKEEALSALLSLGFDKNTASKTVDKIMTEQSDFGVEALLKEALKRL